MTGRPAGKTSGLLMEEIRENKRGDLGEKTRPSLLRNSLAELAEEGGFEPPVPSRVRQFSKLLVSATHPSFLILLTR